MILRFRSNSTTPEYLAFNTVLEIYTTDPETVKQGRVITVACNYFDQIKKEIDFNDWNYQKDLYTPAEVVEDLPF